MEGRVSCGPLSVGRCGRGCGGGVAAGTPLLGRHESYATTHDASSSPFHLRLWNGDTHIHSELSLLSNLSGKSFHRPRGASPPLRGRI